MGPGFARTDMELFKKKNNAPAKEDNEVFAEEYTFDRTIEDSDFTGGTFINSLEELREEDIDLSPAAEGKREGPGIFEWIRRVLFWLFLIAFLVSSFLLVRNMIQKREGSRIYSQLQEEFFSTGFSFDINDPMGAGEAEISGLSMDAGQRTIRTMTELLEEGVSDEEEPAPVETVSSGSGSYNVELQRMRAGLQNLSRINPDIYGWITVSGTNINYPLVQCEDNDYYLNHASNGEFNPYGSIFADYRLNRTITRNYNTVFYGHNISTGDMLHDVTKFFNEDVFNSTYIYIYTIEGIFVYEPFSVYESRYDYEYFKVGFRNAQEFIDFADEVRDKSSVKKDVEFTANDRVLTLSTCTNGFYTQRYALHAKLIQSIVD